MRFFLFPRRREPSEAERARAEAERRLAQIRAETPAYQALGNKLRILRERNHFADAIAATFRGERP